MAVETVVTKSCDGCGKVLDGKETEYSLDINIQKSVPGHGGFNEFGGGYEGRKNDLCDRCGQKVAEAYRMVCCKAKLESPEIILQELVYQLENSGWVDKIGHPVELNTVFQRAKKLVHYWMRY
jgi:hypothetical protein